MAPLSVDRKNWSYWDDGGFPNDDASSIRVPEGYKVQLFDHKWQNDSSAFFQEVDSEEHDDMACVNFAQGFTTSLTTLRIFEQCQIPSYTIDSMSDYFSGTIMKFAITEPEFHSDGCEVTHAFTDVQS